MNLIEVFNMRILQMSSLVILAVLSANSLAKTSVSMLLYQVWEKGADVYQSRILINENFVRLDSPKTETDDFTLYDRKSGVIYNVVEEDASILEIMPQRPMVPMPLYLVLNQKERVSDAPKIANQQPVEILFTTNNNVCRTSTVVRGLMVEEMLALSQFHQTLGWMQRKTITNMPKEMQNDCMLTDVVYKPELAYQQGLILSTQDDKKKQLLVDFKTDMEVDDRLFVLPKDYDRNELKRTPLSI